MTLQVGANVQWLMLNPCVAWCSTNGCVEVAFIGDQVSVRGSKDPYGQVLLFSTQKWRAFFAGVRDGEFEIA
jgi:hypothetical protein